MLSGKDVNVGDIVKMKRLIPVAVMSGKLPYGYGLGMKWLWLRTFCDVGAYQVRKAAKAVVKSAEAEK